MAGETAVVGSEKASEARAGDLTTRAQQDCAPTGSRIGPATSPSTVPTDTDCPGSTAGRDGRRSESRRCRRPSVGAGLCPAISPVEDWRYPDDPTSARVDATDPARRRSWPAPWSGDAICGSQRSSGSCTALLTWEGRFDGGVEGQQIGPPGDFPDDGDLLRDFT